MRMSVWIEIFKIVIFEIKIILCEIKEIWNDFYCSWVNILNVLEWEWMFSKITINENCQKWQNDQYQIDSKLFKKKKEKGKTEAHGWIIYNSATAVNFKF